MPQQIIPNDVRAVLRRATVEGRLAFVERIHDADLRRRVNASIKKLGGRSTARHRCFAFLFDPRPLLRGDCMLIEIDLDVLQALEAQRQDFTESHSDIIRRALAEGGAL